MQAKQCWVVNYLSNKMQIMLVFSTKLQADIIHYFTDFTNYLLFKKFHIFRKILIMAPVLVFNT